MKPVQKTQTGCIIFVRNPKPDGLCERLFYYYFFLISGPRSACGLTALLFCSVVLVLHVLVHGFVVTFDLPPQPQTLHNVMHLTPVCETYPVQHWLQTKKKSLLLKIVEKN